LADGNWLYTALSEERILKDCPDVRDCTVLAARRDDGRLVIEVLLVLVTDADAALDRTDRVRDAIGEAAASMPLKVTAYPTMASAGTHGQGPQVSHAPTAAGQHGRVLTPKETADA